MESTRISLAMPGYVKPSSRWNHMLYVLPAIALLWCGQQSFAAAPAIVVDSQQSLGSGLSNPQGVAVAPNGTIYVADSGTNKIVQIVPNLPGTSAQTNVTTPALNTPMSVAVDAAGNLYIGEMYGLGGAKILELVADSSGAITSASTVKTLYSGAAFSYPLSLAVGSTGTVFVGGYSLLGGGGIYSIPSGGTLQQLTVKGLSLGFYPTGLAVSGSNLFLSDGSAGSNGVYVAPVSGGTAKSVLEGTLTTVQPEGVGIDSAGDLFVLAQLAGSSSEQVIEIPSASAVNQSAPYIIPSNNLTNSVSIAVDSQGNVDLVGSNASVTQLDATNPVYLGASTVYQNGTAVVFNFEFNAPANFTGLRAITVGDLGSSDDVTQVNNRGNCTAQNLTGQTAARPYTCYRQFNATPQYVGMRSSSIQILGSKSAVLQSMPVYELGQAAAQIAYPMDTNTTQLGLIQPQGVAVSGFDKTVYIADFSSAQVFSVGGLSGATATPVSTGTITLSAPSAVAMNGEGDLYIADFDLGKVVVVPTTTGVAPYLLNTGSLLQHPIALALDALGDLYIGDAGSDGESASASNPGFVVEVPYSGSAFLLPLPGVSVIFPQALAFNNINGVLAIGDGGDPNTLGQLVELTASGSASVVSISNPAPTTDPSGLSFDAAGTLYVLDGVANTITQVFANGSTALLPISTPSALSGPSAMASSAGSQSLVVANLGGGTANSLVYLNGNSATLRFGSQAVNTVSASQSVTVANIGNQSLTLNNSYYSPRPVTGFPLGAGTCAGNHALAPTCTLAFQFAPTTATVYSKAATVNSNAYNSGTPLISLNGSGAAAVSAQAKFFAAPAARSNSRSGRKSFAHRGPR